MLEAQSSAESTAAAFSRAMNAAAWADAASMIEPDFATTFRNDLSAMLPGLHLLASEPVSRSGGATIGNPMPGAQNLRAGHPALALIELPEAEFIAKCLEITQRAYRNRIPLADSVRLQWQLDSVRVDGASAEAHFHVDGVPGSQGSAAVSDVLQLRKTADRWFVKPSELALSTAMILRELAEQP